MPLIHRMAVIGVGLIGGSLARALREKNEVDEVIGVGRTEKNLRTAVDLGIIDSFTHDPREGVKGADLVFLSTPVRSIATIVADIAPFLSRGCIVTDGGSVKEGIVAACESLMPEGTFFVGAHPIAGTEKSGSEASFSTLYCGKRCIVTPTAKTDHAALDKVMKMWTIAGSDVVLMDGEKHDRIVAAISHLPHMVAYTLVNAVEGYDRLDESLLKYSAGGFRDFTRIASSDPAMWCDIALMNRERILEMMDLYIQFFSQLRSLLEQKDASGLKDFFLRSKQSRDAII